MRSFNEDPCFVNAEITHSQRDPQFWEFGDYATAKRYHDPDTPGSSIHKEVVCFGDTGIEQLQRGSVFRAYRNRATAKKFRVFGILKSSNCKEILCFQNSIMCVLSVA